jgi:Ca2+-binding EF-hand superfamily protein
MRKGLGKIALTAAIVLSASAMAADDKNTTPQQWPMVPGYGMGPGYHMGQGYGGGYGMGPGYHMGPGYGGGYGMGPGHHMGPGYGGFGMHGPGGGSGYGGSAMIDADGNGEVSSNEAAAHFDAVFGMMDGNDDGKLTLEEFSTVFYGRGPHMARHPGDVQEWRERKEARFKEIDANGDGNVTEEEFLTFMKKRYEESDRDKDGKVSVWEFRGRRYY